MSTSKPQPTAGMRHVALTIKDLEACEHFYVNLLGMQVEWRPDESNVYLTSGNDNLALHKGDEDFEPSGDQRLDHIGFIINTSDQVDEWHRYLLSEGVKMKTEPRTHRDGARSFYCLDPGGNAVQIIFHPPISNK
jgi:catechol 2,3-dioxygenase-like lactoylglutathione lyase family enzyme